MRIAYHRHFVRNRLYTVRIYHTKLDYLRLMVHDLLLMLKLVRKRELEKAKVVFAGFMESLWFRPRAERADAAIESLGVTVRTSL